MKTAHKVLSEALQEDEYKKWCDLVTPAILKDFYEYMSGTDSQEATFILTFTLPVFKLSEDEVRYWMGVRERIAPKENNVVQLRAKITHSEPAFMPLVADTLSYSEKLLKYSKGEFWCQRPQKGATGWNSATWVQHIDQTGGWKK